MKNSELIELVTKALNDEAEWREWIPRTKTGVIGAVQFLAVILWAIGGNDPDEKADRRIVDAWATRLAGATLRRCATLGGQGPTRDVIPRDPVTLLELASPSPSWDWVLAVDDADYFLASAGAGFRCSGVLAYWRGEDSPYTAPLEPRLKPPQPEPIQSTEAPVRAGSPQGWTLTKPKRPQGYGAPLYSLLRAAHTAGEPCPKARDVLEAWKRGLPSEVYEVMKDGLKYFDANGDLKTADRDAIRKAIDRMTRPIAGR